ncbi:SDR family NAD(P)-dependent oxidoreductase, partial [bacterium]|nr:SDR family NAD(P)-dependent oxidoreductase [bacterium]
MQIKGNTFLVTGGSSGLGAGTAERIVELGGNVVIADVNEEAGHAKAKALGEHAVFVKTDVTSEESVRAAIGTAVSKFGGLQGAVSCAGILVAKKTVGRDGAHDLASFAKVIQVN